MGVLDGSVSLRVGDATICVGDTRRTSSATCTICTSSHGNVFGSSCAAANSSACSAGARKVSLTKSVADSERAGEAAHP